MNNQELIQQIQKELSNYYSQKNNTLNSLKNSYCPCVKKPLENKLKIVNEKINSLSIKLENLKKNNISKIITPKFNNNYKALLIGINYSGRNQLYGCINDAKNIREKLISQFKFNPKNITMILDEKNYIQPTRFNIIRVIRYFINTAKPNEKLFLSYSGHGSQMPDYNRDELDNKDEVLISSDLMQIKDDELYNLFSRLNPSSKLFCLMDLCNSGTICDLQFTYNNLNKPIKEAKRILRNKNITVISAARDDQLAYDEFFKGEYQGVLTSTFLNYIQPNIHLKYLVTLMRKYISQQRKINQLTMLSSSYFLRPGYNLFPFR